MLYVLIFGKSKAHNTLMLPSHCRYEDFAWVPVVGPHVGALLGCFLYLFFVGFHLDDPEEEEEAHNISGAYTSFLEC